MAAYTAPVVTASGGTFAQLQAGGLTGQVERMVTANGGLTVRQVQLIRTFERGNGGEVFRAASKLIENYLRGDAMALADLQQDHLDVSWAFSVWKAAVDEIGTLIAANAGTLTTTATGIGDRKAIRTFP